MISIVLLLPFFNKWYCMHCLYNVVIVVVENKFQFNSINICVHFMLQSKQLTQTQLI